jgi:hypothetical protein
VIHVAASSPSVWAQPGTLGFLVVFGMGVVLFFVFRSMSKHLRKVREAAAAEAEQAEAAEQAPAADQADHGGMHGAGVDGLPNNDYDRLR